VSQKYKNSPAPAAHACNPSYSGGRDQEGHSSKPAQASSVGPYLEKNHHRKRASGVAQGEGPEFMPQYRKKKKKKRKDYMRSPRKLSKGRK
jgi:hypothetical protein